MGQTAPPPAAGEAGALKQLLAEAEKPVRSATDLVRFCTTPGKAASEYCDGYLEGATLIWRFKTACSIPSHS